MNRWLMSFVVCVAAALGAMPAKAVTISYSTSGSNAQVFLTPTSTGDIAYTPDSTFTLDEVLTFGNTSGGHYGEAYTYIPFTIAADGYVSATVSDLHLTDASAKPLEWLSLALYEYTGSATSYLGCGNGSALCTLVEYDSTPPTASISSALLAGTQYLLRVGFGLCGCTGQYGGINLTVATTPIPPALLLFMSALLGMGGVAWRRRWSAGALV
jgi:hypothetical protein